MYTNVTHCQFLFSTLEIIFCAFLAENYFVKVLIPFIGVRYNSANPSILDLFFPLMRANQKLTAYPTGGYLFWLFKVSNQKPEQTGYLSKRQIQRRISFSSNSPIYGRSFILTSEGHIYVRLLESFSYPCRISPAVQNSVDSYLIFLDTVIDGEGKPF